MKVGAAYGASEARIRVSVSVVAPKAVAVAQGISASAAIVASKQQSSLTRLAAAVQHVIPAALLQHVHIVLDVVLDPIGRNPVVNDIFVVADTARLGVLKAFYEVQGTSDAQRTLVFTKGLTESKITTETRVFSLSRAIADVLTATDDFYGNANIDDDQVMVFSKTLSVEQQTVSDSSTTTFGKRPSDTVSKADTQTRDFSKGLADAPVSVDVRVVAIEKALADMVDAGDEMNAVALTDDGEVMVFGKTLADSFTQLDQAVIEAGKALADTASVGDQLQPFDLGKGIADAPVTLEATSYYMTRGLDDTGTFSDAKGFSLGRPLQDRVSYGDGPNAYDTYAINYFLETYALEGFPALAFNKALADSVYSTDDFYGVANADDDETMSFGKVLADIGLTSDTTRIAASKSVSDLFGKSDAATIAASKALADSSTTSDAAAKGPGKSVADAITSSEIVVRSAGKAASDSAATADNKTFALAKSLADTATATDDFYGVANADDDETMLFGKTVSDSFTKSDSVSKGPGKGLADSASTSESGSMVWTDYWDINYTVTTSGLYVGTSRTF